MVLEVSNDGSSWTEIDRRDNNNDLNNSWATARFKVSKVPSESFRFFRLKETGQNHYLGCPCYYVIINSLEIFGTLFEIRHKRDVKRTEGNDASYESSTYSSGYYSSCDSD